jgi:CheY-like chemotaxis protein
MPCRVIIVEDHAESAQGLAELLALWGHEAHIARDGECALELLAAIDPHVIVSDIGLPGIDGYELARRVRRADRGSEIVLVALTGSADDEEWTHSGFDHRFVKPVDLDALERLLERRTRRSTPS